MGWQASINQFFGEYIVSPLFSVLFWDLVFWDDGQESEIKLPLIVAWLVVGAVFFTLRMQFINFRAFRHAIVVTAGRYDRPDDPGEVQGKRRKRIRVGNGGDQSPERAPDEAVDEPASHCVINSSERFSRL